MRVGTRFVLTGILVFFSGASLTVLWISSQMRVQALHEAEHKASLILDRNLATHTYFTRQLKPAVFKALENNNGQADFDPAWMSSSFAVRGMRQYFNDVSAHDYYYKECAIDARNPRNEADEFERLFLEKTKQDPELVFDSGIRRIDGMYFFVLLRRGEVIEEACMRCHSRPEMAPPGLLEQYGSERSFNRNVGEVVSSISIRVPWQSAFDEADSITPRLAGRLLGGFLILAAAVAWLNRTLFVHSLNQIREKTAAIARGDQIAHPVQMNNILGEWRNLV